MCSYFIRHFSAFGKANLFVLPNAEKWREAKNLTQKYISK